MNIGTIVEAEKLGVHSGGPRTYGGRKLGEVEEDFAATLRPGDTFLIGGEVVKYEAIKDMTVRVSKSSAKNPLIPAFSGSRIAISTFLAHRVIDFMNDLEAWKTLPDSISRWLQYQTEISALPKPGELLVETFRRKERWYMTAFGFAGKNAHYTLGMILTKRMEEAGAAPLGYVVTDYAVMIWGLDEVTDPAPLFDPKGLRDGLERWIMESLVTKRSFRQAATVAGLIERRMPGKMKTGRQATFSSDILYDTLIKYDPGHLMIDATKVEAKTGMVDFERIEEMLVRAGGRIRHIRAPHVTPLSAPLLMEASRMPVAGEGAERLMEAEAEALMVESGGKRS
jgi:ATP-dependent Lhr-like helicase